MDVDLAGVVRQFQVGGPAGEHDDGQGGLGGVEAVGAADDVADLVVQPFLSPVRESTLDRGINAITVLADRLARFHEFRDTAALRLTNLDHARARPPPAHRPYHMLTDPHRRQESHT